MFINIIKHVLFAESNTTDVEIYKYMKRNRNPIKYILAPMFSASTKSYFTN